MRLYYISISYIQYILSTHLDRVLIEQYILNRRGAKEQEVIKGEFCGREISVGISPAFASGIEGYHRSMALKRSKAKLKVIPDAEI